MLESLKGQTVLITGASRGIGEAAARAFAREGAKLALLARTGEAVARLAAELRGGALGLPCDVADPEQVRRAIERALESFGHVDVLVNNAGIFSDATMLETDLETWSHTLATNATGAFLVTKAVLPSMIERRSGRIINVVSSAGLKGYAAQVAYCASKHAMLGMMRALALEVKPHNIHVYNLCPGGVRSDFIKGTRLGARLEGQVMIEPADVAEFCVQLARLPDNIDVEMIPITRFAP
jgi:3-oxoacyl-[acyl-carrier protein] reductase